MTYSCFKSDAQRFGKGSFLDVGKPSGSEYNTVSPQAIPTTI